MYTGKTLNAAFAASLLTIAMIFLVGCKGSGGIDDASTRFSVTVENIAQARAFLVSGVFNTPVGASEPGPIFNGDSYTFEIAGGPGSYLSFATMYVQSNDLFYAPDGMGIALFDGNGNPISGDVTSQLYLWDAGTEDNEEPGTGANQAPRQAGPNTGPADPNSNVRIVNDGFTYPATADTLQVTVTHNGGNEFTVTIENISTETPLAPGVFVVHSEENPLFAEGSPDYGSGLEAIAEDGNPADLGGIIAGMTGLATPLSPGAWVVHNGGSPIFSSGSPDFGNGLERIAEDGNPTDLGASLAGAGYSNTGIFNIPVGASDPGPITPGNSYTFTIEARPGDYLSFASMFGQSNDIFVAPGQNGIALFNGVNPVSGDVSASLSWWDAGTEANQFPGAGPDQAPRQSAADTGASDPDNTVRAVKDGYAYPSVSSSVKLTLVPLS